jgi:hypothetical protein
LLVTGTSTRRADDGWRSSRSVGRRSSFMEQVEPTGPHRTPLFRPSIRAQRRQHAGPSAWPNSSQPPARRACAALPAAAPALARRDVGVEGRPGEWLHNILRGVMAAVTHQHRHQARVRPHRSVFAALLRPVGGRRPHPPAGTGWRRVFAAGGATHQGGNANRRRPRLATSQSDSDRGERRFQKTVPHAAAARATPRGGLRGGTRAFLLGVVFGRPSLDRCFRDGGWSRADDSGPGRIRPSCPINPMRGRHWT